jgi:hypothetical protein
MRNVERLHQTGPHRGRQRRAGSVIGGRASDQHEGNSWVAGGERHAVHIGQTEIGEHHVDRLVVEHGLRRLGGVHCDDRVALGGKRRPQGDPEHGVVLDDQHPRGPGALPAGHSGSASVGSELVVNRRWVVPGGCRSITPVVSLPARMVSPGQHMTCQRVAGPRSLFFRVSGPGRDGGLGTDAKRSWHPCPDAVHG